MPFPSKYTLARASGLPWLMNWINRNKLLVLTYHGIYDGPKEAGSFPDTFVHLTDFEAQLKEIKKRYHIISPDDLSEAIEQRSQLPPHSALVTFDDGYESFHRLAFPVLQSLGIKSIVFVPTKYVENRKPFYYDLAWIFFRHCDRDRIPELKDRLGIEGAGSKEYYRPVLMKMKRMLPGPRDEVADWMEEVLSQDIPGAREWIRYFRTMEEDEMVDIVKAGHHLGGHTHSHTILTAMPRELFEEEVLKNKTGLETLMQRPCKFFAYPNGGKEDFNDAHKELLKKLGYIAAFSLTQERSMLSYDLMGISRMHVAPEDTPRSLAFRSTGISSLVKR